jgi:hypothetical protein
MRLRELRPFELGEHCVLRTRYTDWDTLQGDTLATTELFFAELARLADDEVDLPPYA